MNKSIISPQTSITRITRSSVNKNSLKTEKPQMHSRKLSKSTKIIKLHKSRKPSSSMLKGWLKTNKENNDTPVTPNTKHRILIATQPFDEKAAQKQLNKIQYYQERIKRYEENKRLIEEIEELDKALPVFIPQVIPSPKKNPHIDCFDMTKNDIKSAFYKHLECLKKVSEEEIYSSRHKIYKNELNNGEISVLCSNVAMVAFKKEHLMWFSKKLNKLFGDTVDYQMKVLLPELLIRIFMDKYNMSQIEALKYLSNM